MKTYSMEVSGICEASISQKPIVLAIDDDNDNLLLINCALELLNCEFIGETSGQAALNLAIERHPDLILLDVIMPDMNGIDFIRALKQHPATLHIPVIAITGLATPEDRQALLAEGFANYLSKPYMVDDLEVMVRQHLQTARHQTEF